jgi:hypothetical protein
MKKARKDGWGGPVIAWGLGCTSNADLSETVTDSKSIPVSHCGQRHVANVRAIGGPSSRSLWIARRYL